jgi:hypothetical protein
MGHLERIVKASNYLVSVSILDGSVDIDRLSSADYRSNHSGFELDEQQTLFDVIRTMFGDYVNPSVKLDDILHLSALDTQAVMVALDMAYGAIKDGELV